MDVAKEVMYLKIKRSRAKKKINEYPSREMEKNVQLNLKKVEDRKYKRADLIKQFKTYNGEE